MRANTHERRIVSEQLPDQEVTSAYENEDNNFFTAQVERLLIGNPANRVALLLFSIKSTDIPLMESCLSKTGQEINWAVFDCTPLTLAIQLGNMQSIRLIMNHPHTDPNQEDPCGNLPLLQLCESQSTELLQEFLGNTTVDVNRTNLHHISALTCALFNNRLDAAEVLVKSKRIAPSHHYEALNWAIRSNNESVTTLLLDSGFDPNAVTPQSLLEGTDPIDLPTELEDWGKPPLYWAMKLQSLALCQSLFAHGASIKQADAFGKRVLFSLLYDKPIREFYLRHQETLAPKAEKSTSIGAATTQHFFKSIAPSTKKSENLTEFHKISALIKDRQVKNLELLLDNITSTEVLLGSDDNSLLHIAVLIPDNVETIEALLKREAPIDAVNKNNQTPLLLLVAQPFCSLSNLMCLLENDADVTHQDDFGSALHYAIKFGSIAAIELLLSFNADPTATSKNGLKAVDFAFRCNLTAHTLICNKMNDKQNNQQARLGHEIIEDTLTVLEHSLKPDHWHILLMLMDKTPSHQAHYLSYFSQLTDKTFKDINIVRVLSDLLRETKGPIVTSFAALGVLSANELAAYYHNLCASYFNYLIGLASDEDLATALRITMTTLNSTLSSTISQPKADSSLNANIMDELFSSKIEEIQHKKITDKTAYSQRFLADLLIARWRLRANSIDPTQQKQADADLEAGYNLYKTLLNQSAKLPIKISILIAMLGCKTDDPAIRAEYAKAALKLNNTRIQRAAYKCLLKLDPPSQIGNDVVNALTEIATQTSFSPLKTSPK